MSRNIIAILRGLTPEEALPVTDALIEAGITRIEVPLNSPSPFDSISAMVDHASGGALIGAGTVLDTQSVARLQDIGAQMVVSPDCNPEVIAASKTAGMLSFPGVFTPTEALTALRAGADGLKFFPAFKLGVDGFRAIKTILPAGTATYAVGGVGPENFADWKAAGISGFGIGSNLFQPGMAVAEIAANARKMVRAYDEAFS